MHERQNGGAGRAQELASKVLHSEMCQGCQTTHAIVEASCALQQEVKGLLCMFIAQMQLLQAQQLPHILQLTFRLPSRCHVGQAQLGQAGQAAPSARLQVFCRMRTGFGDI